ncbi:MAG TPA: hypothetical protein VG248_03200 [Caulobacteraceae bacterium]|jgi:hypothetical protein|nr:hypothetical protein [Caulobacteraceae bacterium]
MQKTLLPALVALLASGAVAQNYPSSGYAHYGRATAPPPVEAPPPSDYPPPPTPPPPAWDPSAAGGQGQIQTPDRAATANIPSAATAPLHDLNLTRQAIPPVLLQAISNPYDPPQPRSCREISHQVAALEVALGADFDEPDTPLAPSLTKKSGRVALTLLHGASQMLLPYSGFIRTLSGAQRHDQLVIEAITAGSARRAYLKGIGEGLRCRPPAAPIHFLHAPPPATEGGPRPRYPVD